MSAAGERHAEEISKILAETDVYVKYGLHQKAVDHLRRVFSLDPENVEAHERLKDIFMGQGREQEAETELLKLAELVAPADPDRAEAYLHELLAMNGTHTGAFELARRFRLRVARMSSVSSEVEYGGGGVAAVDAELDDLDLSDPIVPATAIGVARTPRGRDSIDDFDPDELLGRVAHGSPTPQRPPVAPQPYDDNFDLDSFDQAPVAQPMPNDPVTYIPANELDDPVIVDSPPQWDHNAALEDLPEPEPFDPAAARAFDAAVPKGSATSPVYVSGFEETAQPHAQAVDTASYGGIDDPLSVSGSYDPYGTEAAQTPPFDPTAAHDVGAMMPDLDDPVAVAPPPQPRPETAIEDDLDEADFYASQGMYPEAIDVLRNVLQRYPGHRLVTAKMREFEMLAHGQAMPMDGHEPTTASPMLMGLDPHMDPHQDYSHGTEALEIDEIEEVSVDDFEELSEEADLHAPGKKKRGPTVMLEKPIDEGDADTHYDLGLAYKEMGLYDEAIKAFDKALRVHGREVQCRLMIGMCHREMGNTSEAIQQFKQGLHDEPQERERQSLYYEIGNTYESIGDDGEALYYFEMVTKRDPSFADAAQRADMLRARGGGRMRRPQDDDI